VLPLIGAGLLSGIAIGIGMLLLLVPGLIRLTIWAVIAPVIVVERSRHAHPRQPDQLDDHGPDGQPPSTSACSPSGRSRLRKPRRHPPDLPPVG
jgi:hypothetical protein